MMKMMPCGRLPVLILVLIFTAYSRTEEIISTTMNITSDSVPTTEKSIRNTTSHTFVALLYKMPAVTLPDNATLPRPVKQLVCFNCPDDDPPYPECLDTTRLSLQNLITCFGYEAVCYTTTILAKDDIVKTVVRGCYADGNKCINSANTRCCHMHFCNGEQVYSDQMNYKDRITSYSNKANNGQPNVMFFVTVLLILQTVVRVVVV